MSDDYRRIELITGTARRRHWTTEQKLGIIEESLEPGETVSSVARRRGVAPNLLYRWRRLGRLLISMSVCQYLSWDVDTTQPAWTSHLVQALGRAEADMETVVG